MTTQSGLNRSSSIEQMRIAFIVPAGLVNGGTQKQQMRLAKELDLNFRNLA